ncbi:MAG TPA: T9SS type A sorting domain-containing protein [Bacteroidales bacterium]|nr:T9SS type A sorting domain-containing protein [Bacteroidales bacterium]
MIRNTIFTLIKPAYIALAVIITNCTNLTSQTFEDISPNYGWEQVKIGAGGWVVGMDMHKDGKVIYCRADVGGAYRLDVGSDTWIQLVDTLRMPDLKEWDSHAYGVGSIASAPGDENVVYMIFANGNFYRSDNKGDRWEKKALNVYVEPNGEGRQQGERIGVDPANSNIVYYGSNMDGLKRTLDGGDTWETIAQVPAGNDKKFGIGTVVFDYSGEVKNNRTQLIYASVHNTGIYRSTDAGASWHNISDGIVTNGRFEDAEVGADGVYYTILAEAREAWKFADDQWKRIHTGSSDPLRDIAIDPIHPDTIFLTDYAGRSFRSYNGGETWTKIDRDREKETDIPWLSKTEVSWFSNGEVLFDTKIPGKLWICEGIGNWTSEDIYDSNITWTSVSKGIEELVSTDIISPPGGRPLAGFWDRAIFRVEDPQIYPSVHYPTLDFDSGWDLAYCPTASSFIVATVADHRSCCKNNVTCYSTDRGKTWTIFKNLPDNAVHGNIAVSAQNPNNLVLLPGDDVLPYYSFDRGGKWKQASLPQTSNGGHNWFSSGQDILTSDAIDSGTFYIYHREKGIYRSKNGGESWDLINTSLPMEAIRKVKLRSVQGKSGHLILALGTDLSKPLYRSKNGGETWEEFSGTQAWMVSLGKEAEGADYPAIYIYGKIAEKRGMWRSTDEGNTWKKIGDYPLGITARLNAFEADKNHFGVLYCGFPGNGVAYGFDRDYPPDFGKAESEPDVLHEISVIESIHVNDDASQYALYQNYPNPFNGKTSVQYEIPKEENVILKLFNLSGNEVLNLENSMRTAGEYTLEIDMNGLQHGVYLLKMTAGLFSGSRKIVYVQ